MLNQTIEYINANLDRPLKLDNLAELARLSPRHFSRKFKQVTGLSPHQYIIVCRLEKAKYLLVHTDIPIIEIAFLVGFNSQSHLHRYFKLSYGITPKSFRRKHKKSASRVNSFCGLFYIWMSEIFNFSENDLSPKLHDYYRFDYLRTPFSFSASTISVNGHLLPTLLNISLLEKTYSAENKLIVEDNSYSKPDKEFLNIRLNPFELLFSRSNINSKYNDNYQLNTEVNKKLTFPNKHGFPNIARKGNIEFGGSMSSRIIEEHLEKVGEQELYVIEEVDTIKTNLSDIFREINSGFDSESFNPQSQFNDVPPIEEPDFVNTTSDITTDINVSGETDLGIDSELSTSQSQFSDLVVVKDSSVINIKDDVTNDLLDVFGETDSGLDSEQSNSQNQLEDVSPIEQPDVTNTKDDVTADGVDFSGETDLGLDSELSNSQNQLEDVSPIEQPDVANTTDGLTEDEINNVTENFIFSSLNPDSPINLNVESIVEKKSDDSLLVVTQDYLLIDMHTDGLFNAARNASIDDILNITEENNFLPIDVDEIQYISLSNEESTSPNLNENLINDENTLGKVDQNIIITENEF
ncbi:hypothetical protein H1P_4780001 [Hyella patelloides LEGE 07179]|uniref:HTH araC/xylS-type domain-containing protein n=1 Tax=Hyella patelloides LEGE 07179 TaxID=945734 RepID=A0A563VZ08_9CYAN|nr:AraC family transcriptional regulator [Hyella patelloides]VEP16635.1 hypothetical protein H1P_4780001 [Hyella patelloides LEGE 07179]